MKSPQERMNYVIKRLNITKKMGGGGEDFSFGR